MGCDEARRILWPPERLRIVGRDIADAQTHARSCRECEAYFAQDRALLDLYAKVRQISAPMGLRQRVFDSVATARRSPSRRIGYASSTTEAARRLIRRYGFWPAAMTALLTVVLVGEMRHVQPDAEVSDVFVEDYLRRAVGQERILSDDPGAVRRFLERELGLRVEPLSLEGFRIVSAEICLLEGKRGAMIVYEGSEGRISHYIVPREDTEPRPPSLTSGSAGEPMPVVTWSTKSVEQAMVGEVGPQRLLALATSDPFRPRARASRRPRP